MVLVADARTFARLLPQYGSGGRCHAARKFGMAFYLRTLALPVATSSAWSVQLKKDYSYVAGGLLDGSKASPNDVDGLMFDLV